ncbi:MAG: peptidase S41, partial [Muribaculaceae bacterium]|nr:peptidase S41 [Muribaculaceae bacterium]
MKHLIALLLLFITCQSLSGNPKDSVKLNITDFDFLTSTTEDNYVVYPQIVNKGFNKEYKCMKSAIRNKLKKRQLGIEQAACEYAFWFFDKFDGHYHVDIPMFWDVYFPKSHIRYRELFEYAPK